MEPHNRNKRPRRIPIRDLDAEKREEPTPSPPPAGEEASLPAPTPEDGKWLEAGGGNDADALELASDEVLEMEPSPAELAGVAELRDRLAQVEDRWKRAAADLDNYRKRFDRELERLRRLERETIFRAWLTILDDMERALCAQGASNSPWYEGMEAIHKRSLAVLAQFGVTPFVPEREMFDPVLHEAVASANLPDEPPGKIVEVVQTGYLLEGKVLRPAKVIAVKK